MSVIDQFLAILAPHECLGCHAEGDLLCPDCIVRLAVVPERCYHCFEPSAGARTCAGCRAASNLHQVLAGTSYGGVAKELVARLKFSGAQQAARQMAARMSPLVRAAGIQAVIVPVPTATARVRGRGFDQAVLLARELSRRTRLPYLDCLARSGHTRQLGMSRRRRLSQLENAFRVTGTPISRGTSILLVDDVITTGATLEAAAKTLRQNGAGRIDA
ncbi:MAG: ComF family protein, partial [Candidatus Saccharimonadales bacterium]